MGRQTSCCLSCNVNSKKLIIVKDIFFFPPFSGVCEVVLLILGICLQDCKCSACVACYQYLQKSVVQSTNEVVNPGGFGVTLQFLATLAFSVQAEVFCG